jgi:hypothetical protein
MINYVWLKKEAVWTLTGGTEKITHIFFFTIADLRVDIEAKTSRSDKE